MHTHRGIHTHRYTHRCTHTHTSYVYNLIYRREDSRSDTVIFLETQSQEFIVLFITKPIGFPK